MASPRDLLKECVIIAKTIWFQSGKVKFNKSLCRFLADTYADCLRHLDIDVLREGFSRNPAYITAPVELRRLMLCGQMLVTRWTQKDWWMSVMTSSDSASVQQKVVLHFREFLECVKVLILINLHMIDHPLFDSPIVSVQEAFIGDIHSLILSIEDYKRRHRLFPPKFVKLGDCLLEKLQPEIFNHGHPYVIDISRDVEIFYEHRLGAGSFGAVYKCKFLGVMAAAKVFQSDLNKEGVEQEANLYSKLLHPNVVQFIGYGVNEREHVIVLELMSMDLKRFLDDQKKKNGKKNGEQGPPLPLLTAINIMAQIAEAMNYLHKSGVMHRDLKASNVLINIGEGQDESSLSVKLADFGLSKLKLHDSKYTTKMVGTTRWRAPEAFEDEANIEKYRKSADVYSFALVFFEVLTGEIPFEGVPLTNVLQCIRHGMRPHLPPVEYCPGYLSALIEKCWATNPAECPQFPKISQLLACCKNMILMHSFPSPRNFFMHFDVTRRGPPHLKNLFYRFNNFEGRIPGNPSVSGWGMSEDFKFSFGLASCCVSEATFQDFDANEIAKVDNRVIGCFGVFGTHPGLAKRFLGLLFHDLLKHPHFFHDPKLAIVETYKEIDQDNWGEEKSQHHAARSTACMCVFMGDRLLVANVGDSRAVICTHGEAIALSTNHTPYQAQIRNPGGVRYNHWINTGGFGVSCACGVQQLEQYLVTEPEIHEVTIEEGVDFLVLATAGLWSVVSNQDAVSMVQSIPDAEEAANRLVEEAHRRGSPDNVTCVIVRFHHDA
ncbi:unnamed protein product [Sphagnum troendelagicum]|uniref:Uncharacterized protein n=1 Tax=Sphagnum troendelagicum TaxID=128251 RepID=A0ABP0UI19_9BRYO